MKPALQSQSLALPASDLPTTRPPCPPPGHLAQDFLLDRDQILTEHSFFNEGIYKYGT